MAFRTSARPRRHLRRAAASLVALFLATPASAQPPSANPQAQQAAIQSILPQVTIWRRTLHAHPELGFQEHRTAALITAHLESLNLEVRTAVGQTGVVAILRGAHPGPTVALRADMDALPVTEQVDLPFRSRATAQWQGQEVGVMHACGHDNHVAILMGAASVLAGMRNSLAGTVVFIFQPAEEGLGGAAAMVADDVFRDAKPDAIFGLHVWPMPVGTIGLRSGAAMAGATNFTINVKGRQTHGSQPWSGVDPIIVSAQILLGLQTIASRQVNVAKLPSVITVGQISGGNRYNIIPDSVVMEGTVRVFDDEMKRDIEARMTRTAEDIARSAGATATVTHRVNAPITYNDPALTARMLPTFQRVAGAGKFLWMDPVMASEDFPEFTKDVPGVYFFLGIVPEGQDPATAPANHSPLFFADEGVLEVGVRAMVGLAVDFLYIH